MVFVSIATVETSHQFDRGRFQIGNRLIIATGRQSSLLLYPAALEPSSVALWSQTHRTDEVCLLGASLTF